MKILGNRVLVSKVEEEKQEGFQSVEIQDSFIYKGKVEQLGGDSGTVWTGQAIDEPDLRVGVLIYFAKYSPHTQDIEIDGETMKVVRLEDVIAIV